jgi:hypothetical protein
MGRFVGGGGLNSQSRSFAALALDLVLVAALARNVGDTTAAWQDDEGMHIRLQTRRRQTG